MNDNAKALYAMKDAAEYLEEILNDWDEEPSTSAECVADVSKLQDEPLIWHAVCNCGNWDKISDDRDELQVWFSEHRRDEYERQRLTEEIR